VFEAFETSATCEAVLAAQNALKWDFPGCAVRVRHEDFSNHSFQEQLASTLEKASTEYIQKYAPVTYKAGAPLREIRDTSDPALITGMLMALLEGIGSVNTVKLLQKRVRDTVSFRDAYKPWRRSAFYLVVRVAIQRHLYELLGHDLGGVYYKTIMCVLVRDLLNDAHAQLSYEASHNLRQKLGQRLAKLEVLQSRGSNAVKITHEQLFKGLWTTFNDTLGYVSRFLANRWKAYRMSSERKIPELPQYVPVQQFRLVLPNSTPYLREVFSWTSVHPLAKVSSASELLAQYERSLNVAKPYISTARRHISLLHFEEENGLLFKEQFAMGRSDDCCRELGIKIHEYIKKVGDTLDGYPEFKSRMLLHVLELWVALDRHALQQYPLLWDYHPGLDADIMSTLELLSFDELTRAHTVRSYIAHRCCRAGHPGAQTIFTKPSTDSFAVRYFDHSEAMQILRQQIESQAAKKRSAKEEEWEAKSERYAKLSEEQAEVSCIFDPVRTWDDRIEDKHRWPCEWHRLMNEMVAMRIKIHEHPLPAFEPSAKATVFELLCPEEFSAYRDATWEILATLVYHKRPPEGKISLLRDYSELRMYAENVGKHVSLASAPKSHLQCHYATIGFPLDLKEVCRNCGLKPDYFDGRTSTWVHRQEEGSFLQHFSMELPCQSPFRDLQHSYGNWPSSNEILASQGRCPSELNVHEYIAWQDLLVGSPTRWPSLLRELASTNINFSTDSSWALVTRLAFELGPNTNDDPWGDIHAALQDEFLCKALLDQIRHRLQGIRRNWRESVQLDILMTILLKLSSCASHEMQQEAIKLLRVVRDLTARWCADLQELRNEDANMATEPLVWAALLCKRTFYLNANRFEIELAEASKYFMHASVTLQDNLRKAFVPLPFNLRAAILRDVNFAYTHRHSIHNSISRDKEAFMKNLNEIWTLPDDCHASTLQSVAGNDPWWILLTLNSLNQGVTHYVHYNYVYGTLLVDGRELRTLPLEYRTHPVYRELFGTKVFRAFPSSLPGMSYAIPEPMPNGHFVHIGMSGNRLLVRAIYQGTVLEFLPRGIFEGQLRCDLPRCLIENCYHWYNHSSTMHIEVRQDAWRSKPSNWYIIREAAGFFARRHHVWRNAVLLEPKSYIARQVAQIFLKFEDSSHIMVYQEIDHLGKQKIFVDLKRMELSFYVNTSGLLQSDRLGAAIPTKQDAGTWYGLKSKIVVRSTSNYGQWSVLVPLGTIRCRNDRVHVAVEIETGSGLYLKFDINQALGRIDCPPDPRLLYTKVLLHAITSHFLPDRLTRRTGQEEALSLLKDGSHQPWSPLQPDYLQILSRIADLSPQHEYYPKDLRSMETVTWRPNFTTYIQNEQYRACVEQIFQKSAHLAQFALDTANYTTPSLLPGNRHLESRALSRIYGTKPKVDDLYVSRDRRKATTEYANVLNMTTLLCHWESYLSNVPNLVSLLQDSHIIGGYSRELDRSQLSDLLAIDLKANWGSLAQHALESDSADRYRLMFLYGPMAFSSDVDMDLLKVLMSLSRTPEAKTIPPPEWPAYFHFRAEKEVPLSYLVSLMENSKKAFDESAYLGGRRHQQLVAENKHYMAQETACRNLAKSIQAQWPYQHLDRSRLIHIDEPLLDLGQALEAIDLEWTRLTRNYELAEYFEQVQIVLDKHAASDTERWITRHTTDFETVLHITKRYPGKSNVADLPTLRELLVNINWKSPNRSSSGSGPSNPLRERSGNVVHASANRSDILQNNAQPQKHPARMEISSHREISSHDAELITIVQDLQQEESPVFKKFGEELENSIKAHITEVSKPRGEGTAFHRIQLQNDLALSKQDFFDAFLHFRGALAANDSRNHWLEHAQLWPRMTIVELLKELSSTNETAIAPIAKTYLVQLGVKLTNYQRLLRIEDAQKKHKFQQREDEQANVGHTNWNPIEHVDWLLLEIDGNVMLREEQVVVALAIIAPDSGENTVLQFLMGKGKTSCILRK